MGLFKKLFKQQDQNKTKKQLPWIWRASACGQQSHRLNGIQLVGMKTLTTLCGENLFAYSLLIKFACILRYSSVNSDTFFVLFSSNEK